MNCGSVVVVRELSRRYPEEAVLAQLRAVYRKEVEEALAEVVELWLRRRGAVDALTYDRALTELHLVVTYAQAGSANLSTSEALLKLLLRNKRRLSELPAPSGPQ